MRACVYVECVRVSVCGIHARVLQVTCLCVCARARACVFVSVFVWNHARVLQVTCLCVCMCMYVCSYDVHARVQFMLHERKDEHILLFLSCTF